MLVMTKTRPSKSAAALDRTHKPSAAPASGGSTQRTKPTTDMSVVGFVLWVLPPLAGAALGLWVRSSAAALLLGLVLVITSIVVWSYSWNYSNNDCQPGEPCPTGYRVIEIVFPILFLGGL